MRYSSDLVDQLRANGHVVAEVPGDVDVEEAVAERFSDHPETDIVAQTGGFGIEPIIYVFAKDATSATDLAVQLVTDES